MLKIVAPVVLVGLTLLGSSINSVAADGPEDLAAVRARFENLTPAGIAAAGYEPEPGLSCITANNVGLPAEVGSMGVHAVKKQFFGDNVVKAMDPEILLLDTNGRVIGVEWETEDTNTPVPSLFGHQFVWSPAHPGHWHPHYMLHLYFQPNNQFLPATWNPSLTCPPGTSPPSPPQIAPNVGVVMNATREGQSVIYSITVVNTTFADLTNLFIAGAIPSGTTFANATTMPPNTGLRGVEGGAAVFLAERVPTFGTLGPISYKVNLGSADPGLSHAWVHWGKPWDGTAVSASVAAPGRVPPIPVDLTLMASGGLPRLPRGDWALAVFDINFPPGTAFPISQEAGPPVLIYQKAGWMSIQYPDGASEVRGPGSAFLENRAHGEMVVGNTPVQGLGFALVPYGGPPPALPPGVTLLALSEKLEGLQQNKPYVFALIDVRLHAGDKGWNHYHPGPAVGYLLDGSVEHTYAGHTTMEGPGSIWFEYVGAPTDTFAVGGKPARVVAAVLFPADQPPAIAVR